MHYIKKIFFFIKNHKTLITFVCVLFISYTVIVIRAGFFPRAKFNSEFRLDIQMNTVTELQEFNKKNLPYACIVDAKGIRNNMNNIGVGGLSVENIKKIVSRNHFNYKNQILQQSPNRWFVVFFDKQGKSETLWSGLLLWSPYQDKSKSFIDKLPENTRFSSGCGEVGKLFFFNPVIGKSDSYIVLLERL